jgi:hypothetical protein
VTTQSAGPAQAGHGTLHQDQFTVQLRSGALLIKVTPLAEEVIRLAAPDTYERLHALAESRTGESAAMLSTSHPRPFLVSLFSLEPDTPFDPEALHFMQQGRIHRPITIQSLTPGWGLERLPRQEVRNAIYTLDDTLDLTLPFTVSYGTNTSDEWGRILLRLQRERGRVRGIGEAIR